MKYLTSSINNFNLIAHNQLQSCPKTGILLVNLGTPDSPSIADVRRYLAEFLSDTRVIELPRLLWLCILHGIILRTRPKKSAQAYQSIWSEAGSPLLDISKRQQIALQQRTGDKVHVELAMRYGNPSIKAGLLSLQEQGIERLVVLPLYPQYAAATTGSVFDAVTEVLRQFRYVPELHFINNYHTHPAYISALADSIHREINNVQDVDHLVFSYHGMPQRYADAGDPYYKYCVDTTERVAKRLNLPNGKAITTFQSRFGKEVWLQPYTDETLTKLAQSGKQRVAILSPAFSADCLETLEELEIENREIFMAAGGKHYQYIAALNDQPDHIDLMYELIEPYLPIE